MSAVPASPSEQVRWVRERLPRFVSDLVGQLHRQLPLSEELDHGFIEKAIQRAADELLDDFDGLPHRDRGTEKLFRSIGRWAAENAGDITAIQAVIRLGSVSSWQALRELGRHGRLDDQLRADLTDALMSQIDRLVEQTQIGFEAGVRVVASDVVLARAKLADELLTGRHTPPEDTTTATVWTVPEHAVVVLAEPHRQPDWVALNRLGLAVRHRDRVVVITAKTDAPQVVEAFDPSATRLAHSWPVSAEAIPAAFRWTRRALDLVRRGVIPDAPVIDCREHRTQLWLHAEPELRRRLAQDLLKPLFAETANSREILSETLLVWLETRDSAPAIAAYLGVHPQTVRYRWKRINELFGEDLHDPEYVVQLTMLLKASVPLWRANDQSDFERFLAEDAS